MATSNPFISKQSAPIQSAPASTAMQLLAPELAAEQVRLARRQQMAEMLRQQGMEETPTQMVSGWAIPQSGFQNFAKLAQLGMGTYMQSQSDRDNAKLQQTFADKLRGYAAGAPPQVSGVPTAEGGAVPADVAQVERAVAASAPVVAGGTGQAPNGIGVTPNQGMQLMAAKLLYGDEAAKVLQDQMTEASSVKEARQLGLSPQQARQYYEAKQRKEGVMALQPNQLNIMPNGQRIVAPDFAGGMAGGFDAAGNPVVAPIQGAAQAAGERAYAVSAGQEGAKLMPNNLIGADGRPLGMTQREFLQGGQTPAAQSPVGQYSEIDLKYGFPPGTMASLIQTESGGNPNAISPKGAQGLTQMMPGTQRDPGYGLPPLDPNNPEHGAMYLAKMRDLAGGDLAKGLAMYNAGPAGNLNNPETTNYVRKVMGGVGGQPTATGRPALQSASEATTLQKSAEGNANLAVTRYSTLVNKNANAPVIMDALDNVIKYTPGAITGAVSDRRELLNSLEALVPGFSSAKDVQTKTDLLKKNMNRIVGAGANVPGATDALRTIVEASNPHQGMSQKAIVDASRQLKSIVKMDIANQKVIQNLQLNNDSPGALKADAEFAKNADPKIWEMEDMSAPERLSFINKLSPKAAKELIEKRNAIRALGGL